MDEKRPIDDERSPADRTFMYHDRRDADGVVVLEATTDGLGRPVADGPPPRPVGGIAATYVYDSRAGLDSAPEDRSGG